MNTTEIDMYSVICSHDGIKAKDIARAIGLQRTDINRLLYNAPFIHELCYMDEEYCWHGLIRQSRPHLGLSGFCGYYSTVGEFLSLSEDEWLEELKKGCRAIGRNLNDTRGLIHSFLDSRKVMLTLFSDLADSGQTWLDGLDEPVGHDGPDRPDEPGGHDGPDRPDESDGTGATDGSMKLCYKEWEICFELRVKRARQIRIYADVLVITENRVFSLEFKMKDVIDPEEELQAVKYAKYLDVIFGPEYEVIPALVLTRATDLYTWQQLPGTTAEVPVCSGDMLFNLFDEFIGFLG